MKLCYIFSFFLISYIDGWTIPDPLKGLENLADEVVQGAETVGQVAVDTLSPAVKVVDDVDKLVLGGMDGALNQAIFKVEKGVVQGLGEVIGIPVNTDDVNFFLATINNYKNPTKVDFDNPAIAATKTGKVFFITHGWTASRNEPWVAQLTEVIMRRFPNAHVLQVDWSKPASDDYPMSAFDTEGVGAIVSNLTQKLVFNYSVPMENIVLIGHSLGGQISGWAGRKFQKSTGKRLPLIVALDPAGPLFCLRPENRRLNKHDADRVIVIHTDGGVLGFLEACGTVDFFPNGGSEQPGCAKINVIDLASYLNPLSCNHVRSQSLLIEAINSTKAFPAKRCPSYTEFLFNMGCENVEAHMGFLDEQQNGTFFLYTAASPLFSLPLNSPPPSSNNTAGNTVHTINNNGTLITLQKNDKMYQVGNDLVIDIPDRNDTRSRVQAAPGDTIIYVDKGTTMKTIVGKN